MATTQWQLNKGGLRRSKPTNTENTKQHKTKRRGIEDHVLFLTDWVKGETGFTCELLLTAVQGAEKSLIIDGTRAVLLH